jgi:DNA-binding NarL/FixJ family response regulator
VSQSPRVLCIEDDPEILELLVEVLEEAGFAPDVASDGLSGLARIRAKPDIVLCDIDMPGLTGFEVLEKLRAEAPALQDIPFIYLTAHGTRDNRLRAYQLGSDDYITKPVDFELLIEALRGRLRRNRGSDRSEPDFRLTERETEVLTWVARGKSSADIAALTKISERTVNFHVDNVLRKVGATSRVQAAVLCTTLGLITP